jgi:hypothetical protein
MEAGAEDERGVEDFVTIMIGSPTMGVAGMIVWVNGSAGFGDGCNEGVNEIFSTRQAERVSVNNTRK